jgi:hypothetical protein
MLILPVRIVDEDPELGVTATPTNWYVGSLKTVSKVPSPFTEAIAPMKRNDKMAHSLAEFIEVGRTTLSARVSPEEMNRIRQTKKG